MELCPTLLLLFAGAEVADCLPASDLGGVFVEEDDVLILVAG
jgi:hypothetical protein